jgi:hypothetical protein
MFLFNQKIIGSSALAHANASGWGGSPSGDKMGARSIRLSRRAAIAAEAIIGPELLATLPTETIQVSRGWLHAEGFCFPLAFSGTGRRAGLLGLTLPRQPQPHDSASDQEQGDHAQQDDPDGEG